MKKINKLEYKRQEKIIGKKLSINKNDYPNDFINELKDIKEEPIMIFKSNGEPCVIDKINEIINYINLPWYKKLFYKYKKEI